MSTIEQRAREIRAEVPEGVTLVAVSKFHPVQAVLEGYQAGLRTFGESRANEFVDKAKSLPQDITWHFIGHLQTNKVRQILPYVSVIESVDTEKLLRLIDSEAVKAGKTVDVLLQVHVAKEETKFGFSPDELVAFVTPELLASLKGARIVGVMAMASNVDDVAVINQDFSEARQVFETLKSGVMRERDEFKVLSMGMSHDWPLAVAQGSNMVRIGTAIFGERVY